MTERKLSPEDRAAVEILQLKAENLALAEQGLLQQLNSLQQAKAEHEKRRQLMLAGLAAGYQYDPTREDIQIATGLITLKPGAPPPDVVMPPAEQIVEQQPAPVTKLNRRRRRRSK